MHAADVELATWCWGSPGAPTIVLVHGWADTGASFAAVASELGYELLPLEQALA